MKKHTLCLTVLFALSFDSKASANSNTAEAPKTQQQNTTQLDVYITNEEKTELELYKTTQKYKCYIDGLVVPIFFLLNGFYFCNEKKDKSLYCCSAFSFTEYKEIKIATFMLATFQSLLLINRINIIINTPKYSYEDHFNKIIKVICLNTAILFGLSAPILIGFFNLFSSSFSPDVKKTLYAFAAFASFNILNSCDNYETNEEITKKYKNK